MVVSYISNVFLSLQVCIVFEQQLPGGFEFCFLDCIRISITLPASVRLLKMQVEVIPQRW